MSRAYALLLAVCCALSPGCGDAVQGTTGPTQVSPSIAMFSGRLEVGATRFYSFTMSEGGTMNATLASITSASTGAPVSESLAIGFGTPRGTGCDAAPRVEATAALVPQLTRAVVPGVYCLEVSDTAGLAAAVNFAIRFVYQ